MKEYAQQQITEIQATIERRKPNICRELDIQRASYPAIYAGARLFCQEARAGRIVAYDIVFDQAALALRGLVGPCGCYYGSGSQYDKDAGLEHAEVMRERWGKGDKLCYTPIENALFLCADLEGTEAVTPGALKPNEYPIPWENPGLQALVAIVEEHLAQ